MADESKQTAQRRRIVADVVAPVSHEEQLREGQQVLADAEASKEQTRTPVPVPPPVVGAPFTDAPDPAAPGAGGVIWTDDRYGKPAA